MNETTYCGFVAIIGRPNVGKSTLLNTIMGKKLSITSFRAQTTRHQILTIKTRGNKQAVYVDTPGIHLNAQKTINKEMNKTAKAAIEDVDAILFIVEALKWTSEDEHIATMLAQKNNPVLIAVNKVDAIKDKGQLLIFMEKLSQTLPGATLVPISATKQIQIDVIENWVSDLLPPSPFHYPVEQIYHQSDAFFVSEVVREKIMRIFEQEIPYACEVEIESLETRNSTLHINALIYVAREGQRKILIGEKGAGLKQVGMMVRKDLEWHFDKKVCIKLWAKVKEKQVLYG